MIKKKYYLAIEKLFQQLLKQPDFTIYSCVILLVP